jgi:hypothetical protein
MSKKTTVLATIRSRSHLSVVDLRAVARDATLAATIREADGLDSCLALLDEAQKLASAVSETTVSQTVSMESRAAKIAILGACEHLHAAISALRST